MSKDRKPRKIAMVGHSPTSRLDAPHGDPSWEIWALNDAHNFLGDRRVDVWFEMHTPSVWRSTARRSADYVRHLAAFPGPVYMREAHPDIPTSVRFPFEDVGAKLRPYWGSTFCYMLSLAAYQGVDEIYLVGCDLVGDQEYIRQQPSTSYWLGRLEGMGVTVRLPDPCPLLHCAPYGSNHPLGGPFTQDVVENRLAEINKQMGIKNAELLQLQGSRNEAAWWRNSLDEYLRHQVAAKG